MISQLITDELTDRSYRETEIDDLRERFARVSLLALEKDTRPPSLTVDGARRVFLNPGVVHVSWPTVDAFVI